MGPACNLVSRVLALRLRRLEFRPESCLTRAQWHKPASPDLSLRSTQAAWPLYSSASMTTVMSSAWYQSLFQKCFTNTY